MASIEDNHSILNVLQKKLKKQQELKKFYKALYKNEKSKTKKKNKTTISNDEKVAIALAEFKKSFFHNIILQCNHLKRNIRFENETWRSKWWRCCCFNH